MSDDPTLTITINEEEYVYILGALNHVLNDPGQVVAPEELKAIEALRNKFVNASWNE